MKFLIAAVSVVFACGGHAACVSHSGKTRVHLVELYTSEGCSSCPPAENWLNKLPDFGQFAPLAFHVDYWNDLGWPDRFSSSSYTARQRTLASRSSRSVVYTPEVAVDGRERRGWSGGLGDISSAPAPASLTLNVQPGKHIQATLDSRFNMPDEARGYRAYVALTEDDLSTHVKAGENSGRILQHDHVVRAFSGALPLKHAQTELAVPSDLDPEHAAVVAFVQNPKTGQVAQVVRQPIAECLTGK